MPNTVSPDGAALASEHPVSLSHHSYLIRSLRDADEPALVEMFSRSSAEDIRLRCLGTTRDFPHRAAARLAHCDTSREVALVAIDAESSGLGEIVGVVHFVAEPTEPDNAEFDIMVRTDMKGRGVGFQLMKDILAQARERGLKKIVGYMLYENHAMLLMVRELGFDLEHVEAGVVRATALL
jgi:acetyltransferase